MKKFFLILLSIGFSIMSYAQRSTSSCITGSLSIILGQTLTFSSPSAQCTNCYDWDINNIANSSNDQTFGTVKIVGTDMEQTVQIKGQALGSFSLQLTYFDETGCHTCFLNGNVVSGSGPIITPLPHELCFGIASVTPADENNEGALFKGFIGENSSVSISSTGLTFTWYILYANHTLLTLDGQNPTFRVICPNNGIRSFALLVSNGVDTKQYRALSSDINYGISGFSGANSRDCSPWSACSDGPGWKTKPSEKIIVSPNPTSSLIKFKGSELSSYRVN